MYWREWARPAGLWRFHVLFGIAVGLESAHRESSIHFPTERFAIASLVATAACVVLLPLWPQIRFKAQPRVLTLDAEGFKTTIGSRSGERRWRDIRRIEDHDGTILIVNTNGNAMIIPRRAFATDAERRECLECVQAWHAHAKAIQP
jgi:hypothetical protein